MLLCDKIAEMYKDVVHIEGVKLFDEDAEKVPFLEVLEIAYTNYKKVSEK